jgi:hypothetical protein
LRLLSAMSGRCCWRGRTSLRLARSMTALGGCRVPNRPTRRRWPVWVGAWNQRLWDGTIGLGRYTSARWCLEWLLWPCYNTVLTVLDSSEEFKGWWM